MATTINQPTYVQLPTFQSALYLWIIVLMGIFYTLPVLQLIIQDQRKSTVDGNLDFCYYNFLCKVPALGLEDFGHVFSNVSYVIGGVIFIAISYIRSNRYKVPF